MGLEGVFGLPGPAASNRNVARVRGVEDLMSRPSFLLLPLALSLLSVGCDGKPARPAEAPAQAAAPTQTGGAASTLDSEDANSSVASVPTNTAASPRADGCHVMNKTSMPLELSDTAIDEPLGVIAPGSSMVAGGHFKVVAKKGGEVQGYCATGTTVTVVRHAKSLKLLGEDGQTLPPEGQGP